MPPQGPDQFPLENLVDPDKQLRRRFRADQLFEEGRERLVRHLIRVQRWGPHLLHAVAQPTAVLGVLPEMERCRTLDLPFGNAVEVRSETPHRLALHVQITPEQLDRTVHPVTRPRNLRVRAETRERSNPEVVPFRSDHVHTLLEASVRSTLSAVILRS